MAGYSQQDHILRIDTILNDDASENALEGDPLLLAKIDGVEGISRLFGYDVVMLRDAGGAEGATRPPIDPTKLIDTHVTIGARPDKDEDFIKRAGMFETFEDILGIDITHALPAQLGNIRDFHIYRARIVPWVKVLSRDICYRVFENKTVVDILQAICDEAKKSYPKLKVDLTSLSSPPQPFPSMDYCVQFGESTLDFMFRIMARFGIWYYFGYTTGDESLVLNGTMIVKGQWDRKVPVVGHTDVTIVDDNPDIGNIGKLVRRYRTPERRVAVGGFNYLDPTHPYYKDGAVDPAEDLLKAEGGAPAQTQWAGSTAFAEPLFADSDAAAAAKTAASQNQSEVFLLSCITRNNTFASGYYFHIEKDKNFDPADNTKKSFNDIVDHDFIVDALSITSNDYTYINLTPNNIIGELLDSVFKAVSSLEADALDYSNNALLRTSLWATRAAEAKIYPAVNRSPALDRSNPPAPGELYWTAESNTASGLDVTAGGLVNTASSLLGYSVDLKQAILDHKNIQVFAVGVIAVPAKAPVDLPLPLAARPVARGPHTAVVIGPDGVSTKNQDLYCDAIGRVRVRFPWDPGPPQGDSKLPPVFPFAQPDKPTTSGGNTCW
ncbi:MAG: contractile injection system protein, VgrG/Pvc8 family, partial [Stellaceae bacterium]